MAKAAKKTADEAVRTEAFPAPVEAPVTTKATETPKSEPAKSSGGFTPPDNFSGWIKEVVAKIGHKAGKADVLAAITSGFGAEAATWAGGKKTGLSVAINNANKANGFSGEDGPATPRTRSAPAPVSAPSEPSLSDLMHAQDVLHTVGMSAPQLLKLVTELKSVGSLVTLEACLVAIEKIQAGSPHKGK